MTNHHSRPHTHDEDDLRYVGEGDNLRSPAGDIHAANAGADGSWSACHSACLASRLKHPFCAHEVVVLAGHSSPVALVADRIAYSARWYVMRPQLERGHFLQLGVGGLSAHLQQYPGRRGPTVRRSKDYSLQGRRTFLRGGCCRRQYNLEGDQEGHRRCYLRADILVRWAFPIAIA